MGKQKIHLHWQIIIGLLAGVVWAFISSYFGLAKFTLNWIDPFGEIFIKLLKLIAIPLVLFSIIGGVAGIGTPEKLGKMGLKTLALYLGTTVIAISLGLSLVNVIAPGKFINEKLRIDNRIQYELWANNNDIKIVDNNCATCNENSVGITTKISAQKSKVDTSHKEVSERLEALQIAKEVKPLQFIVDMVPSNIFTALGSNKLMMQVIFFSIFFGISLVLIPKEVSSDVTKFINGLNAVFIKMVELIMMAAPYFVFALMAGIISKMAGDDYMKMIEIFKSLSWYFMVVVLGLMTMTFGIYPLILKIFLRDKFSYIHFFKGISEAQTLAFSTSSSAATLPITMECMENNLGIDKRITSFVLPIGATINMDGTSLYQAIAVIFLAQIHNIELDFHHQIIIILTATLASIGSAAIPGAGLVMLMIVLQSVGLNPAWIAIILPVDRLLDMMRTVVNVTGDASITTIISESNTILAKKT